MRADCAGTPDPDRRHPRERPISTGSGLTLDSEELDESSLATADSPDTSHLHLDPVRVHNFFSFSFCSSFLIACLFPLSCLAFSYTLASTNFTYNFS